MDEHEYEDEELELKVIYNFNDIYMLNLEYATQNLKWGFEYVLDWLDNPQSISEVNSTLADYGINEYKPDDTLSEIMDSLDKDTQKKLFEDLNDIFSEYAMSGVIPQESIDDCFYDHNWEARKWLEKEYGSENIDRLPELVEESSSDVFESLYVKIAREWRAL